MRPNRRALLACLPALTPMGAAAFRFEAPAAGVAAEYGEGCDAAETHEALRAELARLLEGRPLPEDLAPQVEALARCPFCGCGVLGAQDHGESPPAEG